MNSNKLLLPGLYIIILFTFCKKDDNLKLPDRNIEFFSSDYFKKYDSNLSGEDFLLDTDGSVVVVGNGQEQMFSIRQPFIMKIGLQKEIVWQKYFNFDQNNIYRRIDIIHTSDNNYAFNTYALSSNPSQYDLNITKVSPEGSVIWNKKFLNINRSEKSSSIIQLPNEDFIVLSKIEDDFNFIISNHFQLNRISSVGDTIWSKLVEHVNINSTNGLIAFQNEESLFFIVEKQTFLEKPGEVIIYKFNFDGNLIWQKSLLLPGGIFPGTSNLIKIANSKFIIMFSSRTPNSNDSFDAVLKKMDQDGNEEWEYNPYSGIKSELTENLIQTKDGNFVLLATTASYGNGEFDIMLTKLDTEGNIIWDKVYGGSSSEHGSNLLERDNGNLIIMGNTNQGNNSDAIFDFFILETDSEGNPI